MKNLILCTAFIFELMLSTVNIKARNLEVNKNDSMHFFLMRGLTREAGHWGSAFEDSLRASFPKCRVTYLDIPGAGKYHSVRAKMNIADLMEYIRKNEIEALRETPGQNILVATSLGGMVATEWVKTYPNDFKSLALLSASFGNVCSTNERINKSIRKDALSVIFKRNIIEREKVLVRINSNDTANYLKTLGQWVDIQIKRPMTRRNMIRQSIAGYRYNLEGTLPDIPILILGSKMDKMVSPTCIVKVHKRLGGELKLHETAGHGLPIDAPMWIVKSMSSWISNFENANLPQRIVRY